MLLTWPTAGELLEIEQDLLPTMTQDDLAFQLMPIANHDSPLVEWEQMDNFTGLMQVRGPDGEPASAPNVGFKRLRMEPGVYGEWTTVRESDILFRRQPGTYNVPIKIDDLVMSKQDYLLNRRLDRMRWIIWTLLVTGAFTVPGPNGSILHAGFFAVQQVAAAVVWSDYTLSKPLADLRGGPIKFRGVSASFRGGDAMIVMNLVTFNHMIANNNQTDLGKTRVTYGETINALSSINELLIANDLPPIKIYDKGYYPDGGGAFTTFIPDGKVLMIGARTSGAKMGEFQMTRNAVNPDAAPGPYTEVTDSLDTGSKVPRRIRVDDGFNGGPALMFPSLVIVLTVL